MSQREKSKPNPRWPWYQNIPFLLTWLWAGINGLALLITNLDALTKWINWSITIWGSILILVVLIGIQAYLKLRPVQLYSVEGKATARLSSLTNLKAVIPASIGVLVALWIPRMGELYVPPKTANIRIAVADFIVADDSLPSSAGNMIAQEVYKGLEESIDDIGQQYGNIKVEILPPDRVPNIRGTLPTEIETSVEDISQRLSADIVIYGILTKSAFNDSANVQPFFFVAGNSVFGFPEFVGQDMWGSELEYPFGTGVQDTLSRQALSDVFKQRTTSFIYAIYGVWKYSRGDYSGSYELLQKATESTELNDREGLSVWYLWWGNVTLKLENYEEAYEFYQAALEYRPGYARAFIGLAETTISQTNHLLSSTGLTNTQEFIDTTNVFLDNALVAADRPDSADIDLKVEFILGRIAQMKFYYFLPADPQLLNEAHTHYENVTKEFKNGNKRVTEQAGLSFLHLGEISMARHDYALASTNFRAALEILRDPRAIELARSNFALLPVLNPIQAQAELATAMAISPDETAIAEYRRRIECWDSLPTPIPTDQLICP